MVYSQLAHEPTRPCQLAHDQLAHDQLAHANSPTGQLENKHRKTLRLFCGLTYNLYQLAHSDDRCFFKIQIW